MKRRDFMKGAVALCAAGTPILVFANTDITEQSSLGATRRRFFVTQNYQLEKPAKSISREMKLWIPLPVNTDFQQVSDLRFSGNYQEAYITDENVYQASTLFALWPDTDGPMTMTAEMVIETQNWEPMLRGELDEYQTPSEIVYPEDVQRFLEPTAMMPVDGVVRETALNIVGEETDLLKKAHLIYEWVTANMHRDNSVMGCGTGDAETILTTGKLGGKCTDISSVFVALARAVDIPAREMFGIRLGAPSDALIEFSSTAFGSADENGLSNISGGQHCRAQFYLAGYGWVPCDPADVTKMRLTEGKEHSDAQVQAVNDYLFGNWDMNWVGFNYGRDFDLYPLPEQTPTNQFGYPYAEVDGYPLNFYNPTVFAYDYKSQEQ